MYSHRARDLVAKDLNGYSDPYCVVKINSEVKYRTRVKKKTLNPEWEETLMTHLPRHPDILAIVSIRLSLCGKRTEKIHQMQL